MQNLIVFCHCCFTWIEPHSETCPDCGAEVVLDRPDPEPQALAESLGKPLNVLGPVRVERRVLPSYGYLVGTTVGLLFLPRLHRRTNGAWEEVTSHRLPGWWPFRGDLNSPRFLKWLRRPFGFSVDDEQKAADADVPSIESLADRLMDSPGAFFVERRFIRAIAGRRRMITLERGPLRSVTLVDETTDGTLLASLNSLTAQAAWHESRAAL